MNLRIIARQVIETTRREGVWSTVRKSFTNVTRRGEIDDFDRAHGTNTAGIEPLWKLKIQSPNVQFGGRYQVSDEEDVVGAIDFLHEDLTNFTFVDLGCGKGRALLIASKLGFKRIIGVEFAVELVEIARNNLERTRCANGTVIHSDAAEFQFPKTDLVVYLYNPFSQEVMTKVVENLRENSSNALYIIYRVPKCAEVFDSSGYLIRIGSPPAKPYIQLWKATTQDRD